MRTTMRRTALIISALIFAMPAMPVAAQSAAQPKTVAEPKAAALPLELADGAPSRYIVVPGDTLWDIAGKFLKTPYRWGELWQLNSEEIRNPQRIYPGQVLVLDKSGLQPQLKLITIAENRREYIEPIKQPIASIAPDVIEPFLSEPRVVDAAELDQAARVVGIQDGRVIAGAGDTLYVTPLTGTAAAQKQWQVFRPGSPLKDPESKAVLGHEAFFLGTARLTGEGSPSIFTVRTAREEIAAGDRLLPAPRADVLSYVPRAPGRAINARVLGIYGGVNFSGPQSVVTLNKGKADGLEPGHVLITSIAGEKIDDRYNGIKTSYQAPSTKNGTLFVFRVFERVAYALVMGASKPVEIGDTVSAP